MWLVAHKHTNTQQKINTETSPIKFQLFQPSACTHGTVLFLLCFFSGWICYAEKTHGSYILPYISSTKSPQQVMGSLVKDYLASQHLHKSPDSIYHVTVMPCFDKKLEASRADFYNDLFQTRDVDCVITSGTISHDANDPQEEYYSIFLLLKMCVHRQE